MYLKDATISFKKYTKQGESRDHDHCELCGAKFMETGSDETLTEGYATDNNYCWICQQCFHDFKGEYEWKLENGV